MIEQEKSPTGGQGFPNSFGGEYGNQSYSEIAKKASGAKIKWAGPIVVRPTQPNERGGNLLALADGLQGLWKSGTIIDPYMMLHAARVAADGGRILLAAIISDGKPSGLVIRQEDVDAWFHGEAGA